MRCDKEDGFFMWETLLAGLFIVLMAGSLGLYVKAAELKEFADGQGAAVFLARAQISYAQSRLDQEGKLPAQMPYLGEEKDLEQNHVRYHVAGRSSQEGDMWQLEVEVSWEMKGHEKKVVFSRQLGRNVPQKAAGSNPA